MMTASASPIAALTISAIYSTLHGRQPVEAVVKRTLREGTRSGSISNSDERGAVASAIFGTSLLRARLAHLLASIRGPIDGNIEQTNKMSLGDSRRLAAARGLLAIFLLHETPQRVDPQAMSHVLPPHSLGIPTATLDDLAGIDPSRVRWPAAPAMHLASRYSLPVGLARLWLRCSDGDVADAGALAASFNTPGPVMLRANVHVLEHESYSQQALVDAISREQCGAVADGTLRFRNGVLSPWAVALDGDSRSSWGGSVWSLQAWKDGMFEVQDEGSQCIALACEVTSGERILDLCAGNGGKTLALAALVGAKGRIMAHDVVDSRLAALRASAARARVPPGVIHTLATAADGHEGEHELRRTASRLAPDGFDVVLVDAPCSSSGTLRRHPGLRWSGQWAASSGSKDAEGGDGYPELQLRLLNQAASLVRPGGRLVYATCSLDPSENDEVADAFEDEAAFLADERTWEAWPFEEGTAGRHEGRKGSLQAGGSHRCTLWPHRHGTDGFFICRWRRMCENK